MGKFQHLFYPGGIKNVAINTASSGDATLVAAVAGKSIVVLSGSFVVSGAVTVGFKSGSTVISGAQAHAANGGIVRPHNPVGWFKTAPGEALVIALGGAVQVSGELVYQVID